MEVDLVGGKFNLIDVNVVIGLGQFVQFEVVIVCCVVLVCCYFVGMCVVDIELFGVELLVEDFMYINWYMFQIVLLLDCLKVDCVGFMVGLKVLGIGVGVYYLFIYLFKFYCEFGWKLGMFLVVECIGCVIVMLLMFVGMEDFDVDCVVSVVC